MNSGEVAYFLVLVAVADKNQFLHSLCEWLKDEGAISSFLTDSGLHLLGLAVNFVGHRTLIVASTTHIYKHRLINLRWPWRLEQEFLVGDLAFND